MDNKWVDLKGNVFYRLFVCSCYVNVSENTYILIGGEDGHEDQHFISDKYDEMIDEYVNTMVHPADKELVKVRCSREPFVRKTAHS